MKRVKSFAVSRPFIFSIAVIVSYTLLSALTYPLQSLFTDGQINGLYGTALSKLAITAVFLLILWRFKWLKLAGLTAFWQVKGWVVILVLLAYMIPVELYIFAGGQGGQFPDLQLGGAVTVQCFAGSFLEEIMFRALVLTAMLLAWGNNGIGRLKAVVLSAIPFGLAHLLNIGSRPMTVILLQAMVVIMPGIIYATLVVISKSIWPGVVVHWLTNAAVNLMLVSIPSYNETTVMWVLFGLSLLPLTALSLYIAKKTRVKSLTEWY